MKSKAKSNCRRKGVYPTEARARILGAFKAVCSHPLWPYVCPECGGWHLTKQPQKGVTPIEAGKAGIFQ